MLFLHNSYGTLEFPDCGNLVGADCMGNLRWANTEPSMHFRETNMDQSMHFRKDNTEREREREVYCSDIVSTITTVHTKIHW